MKHIIAWFSGGATSAVACSITLKEHPGEVVVVAIDTGSHHPDFMRFLCDCEKWFGEEIVVLRQAKFSDHLDVIEKTRYINGPTGARCTTELKKKVREAFEKSRPEFDTQVWGFEFDSHEQTRARRHMDKHPETKHLFPLISHEIDKKEALRQLLAAGVEVPAMYRLGYQNANCVGCPKGGMAYWNHIRKDFPAVFARMVELERQIGRSCLKKYFLDELPVDAGRGEPPLVSSCGSVGEGCEMEMGRAFASRE